MPAPAAEIAARVVALERRRSAVATVTVAPGMEQNLVPSFP